MKRFQSKIDKICRNYPPWINEYIRWKISMNPILNLQFALITESVEALREKQMASGEEIGGLFKGLMQRVFCGEMIH